MTRRMLEPGYTFLGEPHSATRVGIACSGGGVRSAAFCLGALQRLSEDDQLGRATYVSAVSGGNYVASSYAVLKSRSSPPSLNELPAWSQESPELKRLRAHSDYLAPGVAGKIWLILNFLYGFALTLPPLVGVMYLAGWIYERAISRLLERASLEPGVPFSACLLVAALSAFAMSVIGVGFRRIYEIRVSRAGAASELQEPVSSRSEPAQSHNGARALLMAGARRGASFSIWLFAVAVAIGLFLVVFPIGSLWLSRLVETISRTARIDRFLSTWLVIWIAIVILVVAVLAVLAIARRYQVIWPANLIGIVAGPLILLIPFLASAGYYSVMTFGLPDWFMLVVIASVLSVLAFLAHTNSVSLHSFYRSRLASVFCMYRKHDAHGRATATSIAYSEPVWLSSLAEVGSGPRLVTCAAVNLSDRETPVGRRCDSITFSSDYSGSPSLGMYATEDWEGLSRVGGAQLTVPSIMAISGAALSPVMGRRTVPSVRFLLALLNVRLGVWVVNPSASANVSVQSASSSRWTGQSDQGRSVPRRILAAFQRSWREPGLLHVLREAMGRMGRGARFVYVTDGGHWDNLGLVELVRRRCSDVVVFDASFDPRDRFLGLQTAVGLCRSELGVDVEIDPEPLRRKRLEADSGLAESAVVVGEIRYPDQPIGRLVYSRAIVSQDSPADLKLLAASRSDFPDKSTGDQFFDDTVFEAFRALGSSVAPIAWERLGLPPLAART
jgi:hypothetical protein